MNEIVFMREFQMSAAPKDLRSLTWKELHDWRSRLHKAMREMLNKCERDKVNPTADQLEAFRYAEKVIDGIDEEFDARDKAGSKEPRGPEFVPAPGIRTLDGQRVEVEPRAGEIGLRYSELFHGRKDAALPRGEFRSFNEFLEVAASGKYDARVMTTGLSDGGAQVPEFWARDIYDAALEESVCLGRCRVFPMQSGTLHIPAWDSHDHTQGPLGSFRASWLEEDTTAPKASPKMRLLTLTAKKLGIYVDASREVLEDGLSLAQQIGPVMRQSLAWAMDDSIINGSGIARPMGILAAPSTIGVNRTAAGEIQWGDVLNMYTRLLPSMRAGAQWIVSPAACQQLYNIHDTGNNMIFSAASFQGVSGPVAATLLGHPVYISEKAPTLGTKGDLVLCNLGAYALGMRSEIILERSNAPGWSEDLMSFRVIVRFDGHPLLDKPVTPANGGATLSWAVVLE